jgi:NYN domain
MKPSEHKERVVLFVDYQNVFNSARERFHRTGPRCLTDGQIEPVRLGHLLASRRQRPSQLAEVRVYRGHPDSTRQPRTRAANDRQTASWMKDPLVSVFRRPLRYPRGWPAIPAQEKGVDVALAIDMVRLALRSDYDAAILFSTDTDLVPALEAVREIKAHVEVASWRGGNPLRYPGGAKLPWCHFLGADDYRKVADHVNYSRP